MSASEPEVLGKRQPVPSLACRGFVGHQYQRNFPHSCHGVTVDEPCPDLRFISISPISARALSGKSPKLTIPRGPLAVPSWAPAPHQGERREGRGVAPSAPPAAPPSFGARRHTPRYQGRIWDYGRRQPRACPAARSSAWAPWPPWPPEPPGSPAARRQAATGIAKTEDGGRIESAGSSAPSDVHIHNVTDTSWMTPPAEITDFAQEIDCDVVVCGHGFAGITACRELAEEGKKVYPGGEAAGGHVQRRGQRVRVAERHHPQGARRAPHRPGGVLPELDDDHGQHARTRSWS